jgi:hypothetical protein
MAKKKYISSEYIEKSEIDFRFKHDLAGRVREDKKYTMGKLVTHGASIT